jgi:[histone H4]-lysine20 N-methyltransferase SETD8
MPSKVSKSAYKKKETKSRNKKENNEPNQPLHHVTNSGTIAITASKSPIGSPTKNEKIIQHIHSIIKADKQKKQQHQQQQLTNTTAESPSTTNTNEQDKLFKETTNTAAPIKTRTLLHKKPNENASNAYSTDEEDVEYDEDDNDSEYQTDNSPLTSPVLPKVNKKCVSFVAAATKRRVVNRHKKTTATVKSSRISAISSKLNTSNYLNSSANLNNSSLHFKFSNRKITDYFQIRKSTRKCKSDLEKEKRMQIEQAIKCMHEEGLEVRNIPNKGRGIFAAKYFAKGEFVCEYAGEMISYALAKEREAKYSNDSSIGCYMYFFEYKSKSYCIDATAETDRLGRLLNHSKLGGNCHTKLFEINSKPYLILCASRDIRPGEELTYDYGDRNKMSLQSHPWLAE